MGRSKDIVRSGRVEERTIEYSALPSQEKFHASLARFKGFSGPVGSGKSQALCFEALRMSYVNAGRMGLLGAPTYPMLRDATLAAFTELLQNNNIPFDFNKGENVLTMKDTGSRILFRPVEDFERLRGTNLAWFGIDELTYTTEQAWTRLEARLRDPKAKRLCGFAVWTPKGFDWVYKRFVREKVEGYEAIQAKPFENRHLLSVVPDFYERLKHSYDERFFEQEAMGQYLSQQSGMVYRAFQRDRNVADVQMDRSLPLYWALDFNVDPMSSVVAQKQGAEVVVLDEIVLSQASTYDACEEFHRKFPQAAGGVVIFGDASGYHQQTAGTTDYDIVTRFFRRAGYPNYRFEVPKANPPVRERVQVVNSRLFSASEEVHLRVHPRCKKLIRDFEEVMYKQDSVVIDKDRNPQLTHLSDALGYLIWQDARPVVGYQKQRLI